MKERPILFSGPMVRALLAGTKTQTRRVLKHQPTEAPYVSQAYRDRSCLRPVVFATWPDDDGENACCLCPYGAPGDRLYVRETWARDSEDGALFYRADVGTGNEADDWQHNIDVGASGYRWRPSIHMPRAASRITLEIADVRVERLQDISIADAMAEGVVESNARLRGLEPCMEWRYAYEDLWRAINGPGSWDLNPWVWVVSSRRIES